MTSAGKRSRQRILEATAALAAERGYDGTTISEVSKRSGLPSGSVYWFFTDKDELYAEAMTYAFTSWLATQPARAPLPEGVDLLEGVRRIMRPALEALADPPNYVRMGTMLLLESQHRETGAHQRYLDLRAGIHKMIEEWFNHELDPRVLARAPQLPGQMARLIPAYFDGALTSSQAGRNWDPGRALETFMVLVETAISKATSDSHGEARHPTTHAPESSPTRDGHVEQP